MRVTHPRSVYPRIRERLVNLNHTAKHLSHEYGVSLVTIYTILRREGVNPREVQKAATLRNQKTAAGLRRHKKAQSGLCVLLGDAYNRLIARLVFEKNVRRSSFGGWCGRL